MLLHGFVKIDIRISLTCNLDLSKLFSVFLTHCHQIQDKARLTKISKFVALNLRYQMNKNTDLGPLCLW